MMLAMTVFAVTRVSAAPRAPSTHQALVPVSGGIFTYDRAKIVPMSGKQITRRATIARTFSQNALKNKTMTSQENQKTSQKKDLSKSLNDAFDGSVRKHAAAASACLTGKDSNLRTITSVCDRAIARIRPH